MLACVKKIQLKSNCHIRFENSERLTEESGKIFRKQFKVINLHITNNNNNKNLLMVEQI